MAESAGPVTRSHRTAREFNRYWDSVATEGAVYVAWGGGIARVKGEPYDLGVGVKVGRGKIRSHFGGWLFFAAQGWVNGYPASAILYFLLTRCMGERVWHHTYWREPDVTGRRAAGYGCDGKCTRGRCATARPLPDARRAVS